MQHSRTVASETSKGPAWIALMQAVKWKRAVILASTDGVWFQSGFELKRQLQAAEIEVLKPAAFDRGNFRDASLRAIKRSGIRVVILSAGPEDTRAASLSAQREKMTGGWAWMMVGSVGGTQGWLYMRPFLPSEGMGAFAKQVSDYSKSHFNVTVPPDSVDLTYSVALHDAIMLYARAATKVMSEGGDLGDGQAVTEAVRSTTFVGVGGTVVALDEKGDRLEAYEVMNIVEEAEGGMSSVPVGMYNSTLQMYKAYKRPVLWPGNTIEVPTDYLTGAL